MKAQEMRAMSVAELDRHLLDLLKEQFTLRMQKGSGQLARPSRFKVIGREIARVKTVKAELARSASLTGRLAVLSKAAADGSASASPATSPTATPPASPAMNDPAASDRA